MPFTVYLDSIRPDNLHAPFPHSLLSSGYWGLFPWLLNQLGHEADHSVPSSAEVKNAWGYTSTPPVHPHGMSLN